MPRRRRNESGLYQVLQLAFSKNVVGHQFIDCGTISELMTASNIKAHLTNYRRVSSARLCSQIGAAGDKSVVDVIVESAQTLFALLLLCHQDLFIFELLQQGIDDSALPFDPNNVPDCLSSPISVLDAQRQVTAPTFVQGDDCSFLTDTILPFIKEESIGKDVDRIAIHAAHFKTHRSSSEGSSSTERIVARKRIRTQGLPAEEIADRHDAFRREAAVLKTLLDLEITHPNIVELFAIYTIDSDHYILMSCGDLDLDRLFNKVTEAPACFGASATEQRLTVWHALASLASALAHLHFGVYLRGSHQVILHLDIKPGNVIVKGNSFQLADFGLSSLKSPEDTKTDCHGGTYSYSPPEYFIGTVFSGHSNRKSDVWSLGCVFAELATLAIYGWEGRGISKFRTLRGKGPNQHRFASGTPDSSFHNNQAGVERWCSELEKIEPDRSEVLHTVMKMLRVKPSERPDSRSVECALTDSIFSIRHPLI